MLSFVDHNLLQLVTLGKLLHVLVVSLLIRLSASVPFLYC
jgi:hypothetical protein